MTTRPTIAPAASAALTAQIPSRLVKKLDATPAMAEPWKWTKAGDAWKIVTDKGETVSLVVADDVVLDAAAVSCSCLLAPRCLHVAAVIALLAPADVVSAPVAEAPRDAPAPADAPPIDADAARYAFRVVADALATGAESIGAFAQAELLRAIHACRTAGLHRLASAQTRILRSIRELRADRPEFSLEVLCADLREALEVAWAIGDTGAATPAQLGTARRDYEPAGNLRLRGLFTEAIVARSGHAGAVTYLIDEQGTLYTRADVAPGDAGRAAGAYDAAAGIGDAVLPHRELGRSGLFVSDATASADGRLGAGQKVRAVRATEPSRWDHPLLDARWQAPLAQQLGKLAAHDAAPDDQRSAGWDLVFVDGRIAGAVPGGVALVVGEMILLLTTAHEHKVLPARDNLAVLARHAGTQVRVIGRARLGAPRRLELLAIGVREPSRFVLPDAWHGRANLHYDRLAMPSSLGEPAAVAVPHVVPAADLLGALRRRVERVVQGGLGTLPTHALLELDREAAVLTERTLRGGAEVLRDLAALAHDATRAMAGTRRAIDRPTFARAWLRAALYEDTARRRLSVASWAG